MKCSRCGFENSAEFVFCGKCGNPLTAACPRCGFQNPPGFAFCGKCGASLVAGTDRLTQADLDHLRAYLPASLVEALQFDPASPPPGLIAPCATHLAQLIETTCTYLPGYIVEDTLRVRHPTPGQLGGRFVDGSLLFADISGFTAMSEQLSRIGREGAEEITAIVNRYFGVMLTILRQHDGHLIKFGGDALLGLFPEPGSAARAAQAALSMQTAMSEFAQIPTSQGVFPLRMKVGIRAGRFFAAQLGTPQSMEYALFGSDVNASAIAESIADAGQVLVDRATLQKIDVACVATPLPDNESYFAVEQIASPTTTSYPSTRPFIPIEQTLGGTRHAVELLDALTPYLPAGLPARIASDPHTVSLEGEHRLVALLFANVHGLGEIADRLGPGHEDEIVAALNRYFVAMGEAIHRFGGVINKIDISEHGDKLLAFFGAPLAHEDDAERAVRAALAMQETLKSDFGMPNADFGLTQRIGVSYGYVFAGNVGTPWRREYTVMGDEVNLAARLMSVAEPGNIVVSNNIRRKVQALFNFTTRGDVTLKGKSQPVPTFSVTGPRAVPEPLRGLEGMRSPLVGRDAEWERLLSATNQLLSGRGQIVSIVAEAGLGKSRLASELHVHIGHQAPDAHWLEGRCLSYTESVSYWPFQELLRQMIGLRPDDSQAEARSKLRRAVEKLPSPEDANASLPYLASFLNLPLDAASQDRLHYLEAEALQRRTFVAIRALIEAQAKPAPLVLLLDDLHWLDQASLKLLEYLMPLVDRAAVMLLLLYRPERAKGCWQIHEKAAREFAHCATEVSLYRLAASDSARLLTNLARIDHWPADMLSLILDRTEGNPLYLEEVLRALIDDRVLIRSDGEGWHISDNREAIKVPDTLQGVMMARLDRLEEPPRHAAQVAAVVGRVFAFTVLAHVSPDDEAGLSPCLVRLQQQEIIQESQRTPDLVYAFLHGMMQEVCYSSLLARVRREYHRRIAEYLEESQSVNPDEAEGNTALIAHHAFAGQDWPRALRYQLLAGQQAQRFFANHEAIDHFKRALQSADNLPQAETFDRRQLIHAGLGELLTTTGQYEPALEHLDQARALAAGRGDRDAEAHTCRWLARLYELRGDYPPALEWIQRGLDVLAGRETADAVEMCITAGLIHTRQGDYDRALDQCTNALRIAQQLDEVTALARAYNLLGHITRLLGQSEMAIEHFQRAFDLYERAGDIHGQAISHNQIATAYFYIGQWQQADHHYRYAREAFNLLGDVYNRAIAENNLGGIALNQGRLDEALKFYQDAVHSMEQIGGSRYILGYLHMNLGHAYARSGDIAAARSHMRTSQDYADQAQSRDFLPELYRHQAEAALAAGELSEAQACGQQALSLARELSMRGEEGGSLRVLGDVAAAQNRLEEAEQHLRESLSILEEVKDEYEGARTLLALARLYVVWGRQKDGMSALERCTEVFQRLDAASDLAAIHAMKDEAQALKG